LRRKSKPTTPHTHPKPNAKGFADRALVKSPDQPYRQPQNQADGLAQRAIELSLCIIAKNEAQRLPRSLESAASLVDEIILVDTGSTDDTIAIAQNYGCQVFTFDWIDDFAAARNYSLQQAQGEWILVLDADEVINPEAIDTLTSQIRAQIKNPTCLAINLVRLEVGAQQTPYSLVSRLFRRREDIFFQGIYHELIDDSVSAILQHEPHWRIATIEHPIAIYHYGYVAAEIDRKQKHQFAQRLMQKHLAAYPHDSYMHSKLGALLIETGNLEAGIDTLTTGLNKAQHTSAQPQILFELYFHLAIAHTEKADWQSAADYYQKAIEQPVLDLVKLPAYNNLGNLFQHQNQFEQAYDQYQQVTRIAPNFAKGFYNLGIALRNMRQLDRAIAAYQQAITIEPEYAQAHQNLGVALLKMGHQAEAVSALQRAIDLYRKQGSGAIADELEITLKQLGLV
jgi:glycosyltransferase involved in cell wall biosynthesis